MAKEKKLDWQVPKFDASAEDRYAWVNEQIQEGEGWLSGQTAYKNLGANLKIFDAVVSDKIKSTLVSNGLKYDLRKFVETISEVSEIAKYSSDAAQFKPFAEVVNKVAKGLTLKRNFLDRFARLSSSLS